VRVSRLLVAAAAVLALLPAATAVSRTPVKAPKSGFYDGHTSQHRSFGLQLGGKTVSQLVFNFPCAKLRGTASLQDITLKKGTSGYRFAILAYSSIQYADESSENGPVRISGTFSRDGKRARGRVRVRTERCGLTRFSWSAKK
jgi:hypothetical protein